MGPVATVKFGPLTTNGGRVTTTPPLYPGDPPKGY